MITDRLDVIADELAQEICAKLRMRGGSLHKTLLRAGRALPRRLRNELEYITESQRRGRNPRFAPQINFMRVEQARRDTLEYLSKIDPRATRRNYVFGILFNLGLAVFLSGVLWVLALVWLGLT